MRIGAVNAGARAAIHFSTARIGTIPTAIAGREKNIGTRQDGRLRAASVIDCPVNAADIERAVRRAFEMDCSAVQNPYGDGHSAERIVAVLRAIPDYEALVRKRFFPAGG